MKFIKSLGTVLCFVIASVFVAASIWMWILLFQGIGWWLVLVLVGAGIYGWYRKPKPQPPTPFYDDYPDIG